MKIKTTLLFLCFPFLVTAQQPSADYGNEIGTGSGEPEKRKMMWIHPGNGGGSQFWDFNREFTVSDKKSDTQSRYRDEWLTGRENETLHHYFLSGDSLICTGYENEMTTVRYSQSQTLLRFPITLGQLFRTEFKGRGVFAKDHRSEAAIQMTFLGDIMTMTDGWGRLVLPGGDTLTNVFRVHIIIRSLRQIAPLTSDFDINSPVTEKTDNWEDESKDCDNASWIVENVYRWYVGQSRYPVFETQETRIVSENEPVCTQRSAFIYRQGDPKQLFAAESDSFSLRQSLNLPDVEQKFSYRVNPNPVDSQLQITISSTEKLTVSISLYDMQGRAVRLLPSKEIMGEYLETIDTGGLPRGSYVLRIQNGENTASETIIKQ